MEKSVRWGSARLALNLVSGATLLGLAIHILLVLGAAGLARWEKDSNQQWILSPAISVREHLRQFERRSPSVREMVKAAPVRFIADTSWGRDLDRRSSAEYYLMLFFGLLAGCGCVLTGLGCLSFYSRRMLVSTLSRFREQQLLHRPEGSMYPEFAEWLLYASVWEEYSDAADFAEALRDRYEADWEPEMGRFLANCWYVYEVIRALPRLHKTTGQRFERRIARN
jgi:hypothetical protein